MQDLLNTISENLSRLDWRAGIDILLIAAIIYWVLLLLRRTTAMSVLRGIAFVFIGVFVLARVFDLKVLNFLLRNSFVAVLIGIPIVFQPELRRALERLGRTGRRAWLGSPSYDAAHRRRDRRRLQPCARPPRRPHGPGTARRASRTTSIPASASTPRPPSSCCKASSSRTRRSTTAPSYCARTASSLPPARCRWPTRTASGMFGHAPSRRPRHHGAHRRRIRRRLRRDRPGVGGVERAHVAAAGRRAPSRDAPEHPRRRPFTTRRRRQWEANVRSLTDSRKSASSPTIARRPGPRPAHAIARPALARAGGGHLVRRHRCAEPAADRGSSPARSPSRRVNVPQGLATTGAIAPVNGGDYGRRRRLEEPDDRRFQGYGRPLRRDPAPGQTCPSTSTISRSDVKLVQ